jgi:hypothetical protein
MKIEWTGRGDYQQRSPDNLKNTQSALRSRLSLTPLFSRAPSML